LLRKVLARLGAAIGPAGAAGAAALSLAVEKLVVVELERRFFWSTCMSFVRKEVGESEPSGVVSIAVAEKVAWLEGRRVRKRWSGCADILRGGCGGCKGYLSVGMGIWLRLVRFGMCRDTACFVRSDE
jgi:hypothetical protein